jgi:hypothetical protein
MRHCLRILGIFGILLGGWASAHATMYRVREVEGNSSLLVFRDVAQPNVFYFVPTRFGLATTGSSPRVGIQFYGEAKNKSDLGAAVTLSLAAQVTQSELGQVLNSIKQQFKLDNPRLTPPPRVRNRMIAYRMNDGATTLATTDWSDSVLDASQTITFKLSHISSSDLKRVLSANGASLVVVVQLQMIDVVDGVASGQIRGDKVRGVSDSKSVLGVGADFEGFLSDILDHAVEIAPEDKPFLRDATRGWILQRLGAPSLLKVNGKLVYGWELAGGPLAKASDESIRVVRGSARNDGAAGIVELGDLCQMSSTAILNLDDGTSGCGSLR